MTGAVIYGQGLGKRYRRGLQADGGLRHSLETNRAIRKLLSPLAHTYFIAAEKTEAGE